MERKYPTPIKQIMETILKTQHLDEGILNVRSVNLWNELLGQNVKNSTTNVFVKDHVLVVTLRSSIVRNELSYLKDNIIDKINENLGQPFIRDIYFY